MPSTTEPPVAGQGADPTILAEQQHLAVSRAALGRMREEILGLRAQGGNAVSTEVLQAAIRLRAAALIDDPTVPLFFGRLDYAEAERGGKYAGERFYVGRRHVHDAVGDPLVVDWRAPVSTAFYRASARDPHGLELRRRFGFAEGRLTAYEDEPLDAAGATAAAAPTSRILAEEIERPRVGPMRDIVATIQPEQDEIVRSDLSVSVCVQGAPGTGKTAVGLHRVAYLLYTHRDRLKRGGALVVGPNRQFLKYIEQVLPALGELEVAQATVEELVLAPFAGKVAVRGTDPAEAARVKGDARMAEVLQRAVWAHLGDPDEALTVPRGVRRWRVPEYEIRDQMAAIRGREVRYSAGRAMLAQRLAHAVLLRMEASGESPDDRVQAAVARSRPVKELVDRLWPAVDPVKLLFGLYADPDRLAAAADGLLTIEEQEHLRWAKPPRSLASAKWTMADAVLLDELADRLDRTASLAHVVLDEAQDLSAMQCRAVGRRCSTGSATILGDLAQATTAWAAGSWADTLGHLGKPEAALEELTQGFRVPRQVIEFAARLLPTAAPQLAPPTSVRQAAGSLDLVRTADQQAALARLGDTAVEALTFEGSIGVIVADAAVEQVRRTLTAAGLDFTRLGEDEEEDALRPADLAAAVAGSDAAVSDGAPPDPDLDPADSALRPAAAPKRLTLVPASLAKGLEYDQVVVLEPADIVEAEYSRVLGLRRLYVVLTRAVTRLTVLHWRPLPEELADAGPEAEAGAVATGMIA